MRQMAWLLTILVWGVTVAAQSGDPIPSPASERVTIVDRFLNADPSEVTSYRAIRYLEASSRGGRMQAAMTVETVLDPVEGFSFTVLDASGSDLIRNRVFLPALEAERDARAPASAARGALTQSNYEFEDDGPADQGLRRIAIVPRRKDMLLLRGSILVTGREADLVAVEGMPVKRPSFWTRRVSLVRRYQRIAGTRVPVSMTSTADVLVAGASSFSMTYEYQSVNGMPVAAHMSDMKRAAPKR